MRTITCDLCKQTSPQGSVVRFLTWRTCVNVQGVSPDGISESLDLCIPCAEKVGKEMTKSSFRSGMSKAIMSYFQAPLPKGKARK